MTQGSEPALQASQGLREAMSTWPSGVAVVTASAGGLVHGVTVSSFISVSLTPPLVLVSLMNQSSLLPLLNDGRIFAIAILASTQEDLSRYFSTAGRMPSEGVFEGVDTELWHGVPIARGALAYIACEVQDVVPVGDHMLAIGLVKETKRGIPGDPLVYCGRGYRAIR